MTTKAPKIKSEWNLKLLYKNLKELDKHVEEIDQAYTRFAKKYEKKTDWLENENALLRALEEGEKLWNVNPDKPGFYLGLATSIDSDNKALQAKRNQVEEQLSKIANKILFFDLKLGKIDRKLQKEFLRSKKLEKYHYHLKKIFETSQYDLSEAEEKILNLTSLTRYSLWTRGVSNAIARRTIEFEGEELPLNGALEKLASDMPIGKRRKLWGVITTKLQEVAEFSESEMNAVLLNKKISDELRGYKKPYSATLIGYENDEEEILNLIKTVTKEFTLSRKFYKLKKKLLKMKDFEYIDRVAPTGEVRQKFSFEESANIFRESLDSFDPDFTARFNEFLKNGRIDAYPKKGKRGGAYCSGGVNLPTYVFLNHTNDFKSASTLAHEMGHAFHYELSKSQPPLYQDYTISVAEVASTFFENVLFYDLFEKLDKKDKKIALFDKLDGTISTIFRQIAFFNYELELHETVRKQGNITAEELSRLFVKHMKSYVGSDCKFSYNDGYSFIYIPHFRYMFYVYAYAYGELISNALYERYKENKSYINEIKKFLSAGGSKPPYEIFKEIGINTKDPNFWKEGIKKIERDIKELERLTKRR